MTQPSDYQLLNRLLTVLYRSLPMYLTYASPWTRPGDDKVLKALRHIVGDQTQLANRIAEHVMARLGPVELGEYPGDFLDTHDLSLDYLLGKLVECQKRDIATIEQCVSGLQGDRQAAALAEDALGSARGHLETLEELAAQFDKPSSWSR